MNVQTTFYESPVGIYELKASQAGLSSLKLVSSAEEAKANDSDNESLAIARTWLETYFESPHAFKSDQAPPLPPLDLPCRNKFLHAVWQTLLARIPFGQTISYGELASLTGRPGAVRAVGQAMRRNPISLIVPCHRVLPKNGGIGNYSSGKGSETKRWLLDHEDVRGAI